MINWAYFPRSSKPTGLALKVVDAFDKKHDSFNSDTHNHESNGVLSCVAEGLAGLGFHVETGKKKDEKVYVPVLYGNNGKVAKAFEADAHHVAEGFVIEVEAGRGVVNNQFLKDLFQACMMDNVDYLCIAVRNLYGSMNSKDFERVVTFMETLYASNRISLPLKGILIIGY